MKISIGFKGSIFGQKEKIFLEFEEEKTIIDVLQILVRKKPSLQPLLFKEESLRSDILIIVDKTDVISMKLLNMDLKDGQSITILPLAHGGQKVSSKSLCNGIGFNEND